MMLEKLLETLMLEELPFQVFLLAKGCLRTCWITLKQHTHRLMLKVRIALKQHAHRLMLKVRIALKQHTRRLMLKVRVTLNSTLTGSRSKSGSHSNSTLKLMLKVRVALKQHTHQLMLKVRIALNEHTHRLMLKVRIAVTAITAVAPAALQGSGELLVLAPQLADGAPQVQHQLVLGVQDAQGVALHPQGHAGKVERVQGLLCLSLCEQANDIQDWERH